MLLQLFLAAHVLAAGTALGCFWIPLVTTKGGKVHRRVGWVFVAAMAGASLTAWVICGIGYAETEDVHRRITLLFLAWLGLFAISMGWSGLRALRLKDRTGSHYHPVDLGIPLLLVLAGLGVVVFGLQAHSVLLLGFAPVGIIVGCLELAYWLRPPKERMHWWYQHMGSMIGTCITTVTAFLAVNAANLGSSSTVQNHISI